LRLHLSSCAPQVTHEQCLCDPTGVKFPKTLSAKHRAHLLRWSRTHSFLRGIVEARLTEGYDEPDLSTLRLVIEVKEAPAELGYISAPAW